MRASQQVLAEVSLKVPLSIGATLSSRFFLGFAILCCPYC